MTREAADRVLRRLRTSSLAGVGVIIVAAVIVSEQRGLLLAVAAVYLLTSLAAYFTLRRSLARDIARRQRER
jgi:hypothetical protein